MTAGLQKYLLIPKTIAKHWLKDEELANTLNAMLKTLPTPEAVMDKSKRWLTLAQLEEIGLSLHPLNADAYRTIHFSGSPTMRRCIPNGGSRSMSSSR